MFLLLFVTTLFGCNQDNHTNQKEIDHTLETILKKQILLTNSATFTNGRNLFGASAFLIEYKDTIYAVTAKHLLGKAGGAEPEVDLKGLNTAMVEWKMFPRVPFHPITDTVKISANGLDFLEYRSDA